MFLIKELEPSSQWRVCAGYKFFILISILLKLYLLLKIYDVNMITKLPY